MTEWVELNELQVDRALYDFVNDEAIPGTGIEPVAFWRAFSSILKGLTPRNRELLAKRDELQAKIDGWYQEREGELFDQVAHKEFLKEIGYLVPEGEAFQASTENVDPEFSEVAGPQLVVPVTNARYALNAANARWGSLYDALYGTDAIPPGPPTNGGFDPVRGSAVIAFAACRDRHRQNGHPIGQDDAGQRRRPHPRKRPSPRSWTARIRSPTVDAEDKVAGLSATGSA